MKHGDHTYTACNMQAKQRLRAVLVLLALLASLSYGTGRPINDQNTAATEDLHYGLIPLLIGRNALEVVTNLAQASGELKSIWEAAVLELNGILEGYRECYHFEVHNIIDETVSDAQVILSPILKAVSTILMLLSNATTMAATTMVLEMVSEQLERLVQTVEDAEARFDELFRQTGAQLAFATEQIGIDLKNDVLDLIERTISQMKSAINPVISSLQDTFVNVKASNVIRTQIAKSTVVKEKPKRDAD